MRYWPLIWFSSASSALLCVLCLSALTMNRQIERLKWRSRRGLLELDLVFEKFWASGEELAPQETQALERLLSLPDNDLLDLVMGRTETGDPEIRAVVQKLRREDR
jgi:antitoxin CptB